MEGSGRMRLDVTFKEQIAKLGLSMGDFDYVSLSHFHFDHVGIANEVEGATLIIQKKEYDAAFADSVKVPGYYSEFYENLRKSKKIIIDDEYDVFGDDSVRLLPAPGHTPGHQVLFLDLPETGPIVLAGDLYHFQKSREKKYVPAFNVDSVQSLESMHRIEAFVEDKGAHLWIQHDLVQFNKLMKAPQYYK